MRRSVTRLTFAAGLAVTALATPALAQISGPPPMQTIPTLGMNPAPGPPPPPTEPTLGMNPAPGPPPPKTVPTLD